VQAVAAALGWEEPALHALQPEAPAPENDPAAQLEHKAELVEPAVAADLPAGHELQAMPPMASR